ncbi:MAG TPA: hypothetical protein VFU21_32300 [Kofleriaceae bacterium]|nr:hypothetical protein [Kofleriaceae bacterium]
MASNMAGRALLIALLAVTACDGRGGTTARSGTPAPPVEYDRMVAALSHERAALADQWRAAAGDGAARAAVRQRASDLLLRRLTGEILPAWNGTPWAYSGTAAAPGPRPIACGYFVSTALAHAGLAVERRLLAQQPAEAIILSLVPESRVARFKRVPLDTFVAAVARRGDGLYLVGLDYHVGFLVVERGQVYFHHSSNVSGAVVREPAITSAALARSSYRVVGKMLDATLVEAWLENRLIPTRASAARPG